MKRTILALSVGACLLLSGPNLWAQASAQINGSVTDTTGAVLPGVEITVTQTETGIGRTVLSNETGAYVLVNLPLGPYRLEGGLPGFQTFVETGTLQVNDRRVSNVVLEVGQVTQTIEVQANAALVETRNVAIGQLIENERILALPLDGRNIQSLITLNGAAVDMGDSGNRFFPGSRFVSLGGAPQGFGVDYTMDGAQHLNYATGISMPTPFPNATQEFKVESSGLTADRGKAASVGVVTKSGTNAYHGDVFWFVRNDLFNARNYFSSVGSTLKRNQFGGTVGGPVIQNKLFFFGGYQGTTIRQDPGDERQFIPTAAVLAGDFRALSSPACNGGRQVTLGAPFVDNQIDPALFSPAAVNIANRLLANAPAPQDECGEVTYGARVPEDRQEYIAKVDYQVTPSHSLFGRMLISGIQIGHPYEQDPDNILLSNDAGYDNLAQSWAFGSTYLLGANSVNSFRFAYNRSANRRVGSVMGFSYCDVGVKMYCGYDPTHIGRLRVSGAFTIGATTGSGDDENTYFPQAYQFSDDVSWVRGSHQFSFGTGYTYAKFGSVNHFASAAQVDMDSMADFFLGQTDDFFMGTPAELSINQNFFSLYGAEAWQATPNLTVSYGLRWEPYLAQNVPLANVYTFEIDRFRAGQKSSVFPNAPAGLIYPGDDGFPDGLKGIENQWGNFAPRLGFAWDIQGDGRTSLRASYAYTYAFVSGDWRDTYNGHPPFGGRTTLQGPTLDDPWADAPGGDPFPLNLDASVAYPPGGIFVGVPTDLQTPTTSSWNVSLQREVAGSWLLSGSYIGTLTTHLWALQPINPALYFPGRFDANGECTAGGFTITGRAGRTCSTRGTTQARRRFSLERPADGQLMSHVSQMDPGGTQSYQGMLLSVQRRAASGVTVSGNYTWSHCIGPNAALEAMGPHVDNTYSNPDDRDFDRGNCNADRRHVVNLTAVAETPEFANPTLRAIATGWRLSGIYRLSSGSPLSIIAGGDPALSGVAFRGGRIQRANQILDDVFDNRNADPGTNYLNAAAFAKPAAGTLGNSGRNSIQGPGTWGLDVALTRVFQFGDTQRMEVRAEAFNLTNSFRPVNPATELRTSRTFGIIRNSYDPRILQFALKYVF